MLDGQSGQYWLKNLDRVISSLGGELIVQNAILKEHMNWKDYDYTVLDEGLIPDITKTIKEIHDKNPILKVIVVSAAPRWDQAREVMLAGAAHYMRKDPDINNLTKILSTFLKASETDVHP